MKKNEKYLLFGGLAVAALMMYNSGALGSGSGSSADDGSGDTSGDTSGMAGGRNNRFQRRRMNGMSRFVA